MPDLMRDGIQLHVRLGGGTPETDGTRALRTVRRAHEESIVVPRDVDDTDDARIVPVEAAPVEPVAEVIVRPAHMGVGIKEFRRPDVVTVTGDEPPLDTLGRFLEKTTGAGPR